MESSPGRIPAIRMPLRPIGPAPCGPLYTSGCNSRPSSTEMRLRDRSLLHRSRVERARGPSRHPLAWPGTQPRALHLRPPPAYTELPAEFSRSVAVAGPRYRSDVPEAPVGLGDDAPTGESAPLRYSLEIRQCQRACSCLFIHSNE